jgi:predicted ATPase
VAAAFAAAFDRLATDSPILIAVDDLQWLDQFSKDVMAFAARRFKGQVGLLITERSDAAGGSAVTWLHLSRPDGIERVRVTPLSLGGLHMLVSSWRSASERRNKTQQTCSASFRYVPRWSSRSEALPQSTTVYSSKRDVG